jgi:hypothetical protein
MEGLVRLVAESLERHGMTVPPPRVDWSHWVPIDPNLCLTAPCHPGLFVIAERLVSHKVPRSGSADPAVQLAILKVGQTKDLGIEMARLCYDSPLYDRINAGRCLVRFAVVDDDAQRVSSCAALQQWFTHGFEATTTDSFFPVDLAAQQAPHGPRIQAEPVLANSLSQPQASHPAPLSSVSDLNR